MSDKILSTVGIDGHAHVFPTDLPLVEDRRYAPAYAAPVEQYRSMLETHGMAHGVLVQPSFLGTDNRYLLACLERYPRQFRGVVVIDPVAGLALLDDYHTRGVVGVRANLIGKPIPDFHHVAWRTLLERMRLLDWHLEVQIEAGRLAGVAQPILRTGVRLVVDHFGRFDPRLGLDDAHFQDVLGLGKSRQVWVKISGAYRVSGAGADRRAMMRTARTAYAMLKDAYGMDRLLWGSDWPHTQYEGTENYASACALLDVLAIDVSERDALLVHTPNELFHFQTAFARAPRPVSGRGAARPSDENRPAG
ncbi:MAG: amidohydrolase family protein [Janthinobacterium lividum]